MTEVLRHIAYIIRRFKTSMLLNLVGRTTAFVMCYLLLTQVVFQRDFNHSIKDHERIYRVENTLFKNINKDWSSSVCRYMADELAAMPEVEGVTMTQFIWGSGKMLFKQGDKEYLFPFTECNNTALTNLTDQVIDGSIEWTEDDRDGIVIPASIAMEYFGTPHATGKKMTAFTYDSVKSYTVRGVYKDFPENCTPRNHIMMNVGDRYADVPGNVRYSCLVKFKEGVNDVNRLVEPFVARCQARAREMLADEPEELESWEAFINSAEFRFQPLDEVYFSKVDPLDKGDRNALTIIELILLMIILVATVNTINFNLAVSPVWVRDANMRLVMGASRKSIRLRIISEAVILSLAASLIALMVCQALSKIPATNDLFDGDIGLSVHPGIVMAVMALGVAVGIASGFYPARFTTSFPLATALKGSFGLTRQGVKLRTLLIGLQLVITMILVSFICTLYQQTQFIYHSDYGYDIDQILNVELKAQQPDYRDALRDDLKQLAGVENMAYSRFILGSTNSYITSTFNDWDTSDNEVLYNAFPVGEDYFSTMGIRLVDGRDFKATDVPDRSYIVNEALKKALNHAVTMEDESDSRIDIVGVCENIRFATVRIDSKKDHAGFGFEPTGYPCWTVNVRISKDADRDAIKTEIARLVEKHSGHESPPVKDMNDIIHQTYSNDFHFAHLVYMFSIICIIITLVGMFCLMLFETEYRRKEIGIRKISGATTSDILRLFSSFYWKLILVSFVIATPIAYFISNKWLDGFAEHQPMSMWPFPFSLLVVGGLTLGTILLRCWHTAHANPTDSLKSE